MTTRRFGDDEVREIFRIATTGEARDQSLPTESGGITLAELQRIGSEVGIDPGRIANAVARLERPTRVIPVRRSMGLPVGLTRVVELPRAPTDREWEQLIAEFRTTFGAQGVSTLSGGLRQWSQGNLHISVEPTTDGQQLRLTSLKDDAIALNVLSVMTGAMALVTGVAVAAAGKPEKALAVLSMFGGMSLVSYAINLVRMPRWARERSAQMEAVAEHTVRLLSKRDSERASDQ